MNKSITQDDQNDNQISEDTLINSSCYAYDIPSLPAIPGSAFSPVSVAY